MTPQDKKHLRPVQKNETAPDDVVETYGLSNRDLCERLFAELRKNERIFAFNGRLALVTDIGARIVSRDLLLVLLQDLRPARKGKLLPQWPEQILSAMLAQPNLAQWGLESLQAVSRVPALEPDGAIKLYENYSAKTGIYHIPDPAFSVYFDTKSPTRLEAQVGLEKLAALVKETPFADAEVGRSVWLGYVLTLVARHLMPRSPLFLFDGNEPGGGKTILMTMGTAIQSGQWGPVRAFSNEEFRKAAPYLYSMASPCIMFDEVGQLRGELLKMALTSDTIGERLMRTNDTVEFRNTKAIAATGNNVAMEGDIRRRTLRCALRKPQGIVPYSIRNITQHVLQHREELFEAAIAVLRWGLTTDEKRPDVEPFPSFEEFSRIVREPLIMLGYADPCASTNDPELVTEANDANEAIAAFAEALEALGDAFTTSDVSEHLDDQQGPLWAFRTLFGARSSAPLDPRAVGRTLARYKDVYLPNGRVIRRRIKDGFAITRIERY